MNTPMTITTFIEEAKSSMAKIEKMNEKQTFLKELLLKLYLESDANKNGQLTEQLEAAAAQGGSLSERVVHNDDQLTIVWGHIPPKFQSAVFDHATYAVSLTLEGTEKTTFYKESSNGDLIKDKSIELPVPEVIEFPPDTVRSVENPADEPVRVLQCYIGDMNKLVADRHVYEWKTGKKMSYTYDDFVKQSVIRMDDSNNAEGKEKLVEVYPATKTLVEATS